VRRLSAKIVLAFAIPLALALCGASFTSTALGAAVESTDWVSHTVKVMGFAFQLGEFLGKAESDARTFVSTGDERSAKDLLDIHDTFVAEGTNLRDFVGDNPAQAARVDGILHLFEAWYTEVALPLVAARRDGQPSGPLLDRLGPDPNRDIRDVIVRLRGVERSLLATRTTVSDKSLARAEGIVFWGAIVAIASSLVSALYLSRDILTRIRALVEAAGKVTGGDLAARAGVTGHDELEGLASAFNGMAASLEGRDTDATRIRAIGDMLQACDTTAEAGEVIARIAPVLFAHARSVEVLELNSSRNLVTRLAGWGDSPTLPFDPSLCWGLRRGRPYAVLDTSSEVCCGHLPDPPTKGYTCIPLLAQGETIGVLHASGTPSPSPKESLGRRQVLATIAEQLGLTLGNIRLRERLRNQSIRDPLTGLFNRRYFEETLTRELAHCARRGQNLGVMILDVDHFKAFNDASGHDVGDSVLRGLAGLLDMEFRASDFACRYGGEEFAVVLLDASLNDTLLRAETLRQKVKRAGHITLSIGVASFPAQGADVTSLVRAADQAMYRAKEAGRDRVVGPTDAAET
jgi:diguanylate cyclase (GGDEF)-like protein